MQRNFDTKMLKGLIATRKYEQIDLKINTFFHIKGKILFENSDTIVAVWIKIKWYK